MKIRTRFPVEKSLTDGTTKKKEENQYVPRYGHRIRYLKQTRRLRIFLWVSEPIDGNTS